MTEATAFLPLSAFNVDIIPTAGADILRAWRKKQEVRRKVLRKENSRAANAESDSQATKSNPKAIDLLSSFNVKKIGDCLS